MLPNSRRGRAIKAVPVLEDGQPEAVPEVHPIPQFQCIASFGLKSLDQPLPFAIVVVGAAVDDLPPNSVPVFFKVAFELGGNVVPVSEIAILCQ